MPGVAWTIEVDDSEDPRLDDFRDLTAADRRPDRPGGRGLVIAEGAIVVRRLLASRYPVRAVLGVPRKLDELAGELAGLQAPVYPVTAELMAEVVGFHLNRGVLAVADRAAPPDLSALVDPALVDPAVVDPAVVDSAVVDPAVVDPALVAPLAVLEGINDHENLGSLFRNAAALGVAGVLLGPRCADPLYRRSVRVSMGHVLRVPFASLPLDPPWPAGLDLLRRGGRRVVALTPRAEAVPLSQAGLAGLPVALLLGAEGPGLSDAALAAADLWVRIPMAEQVDSLNVATAAAIAFHAAARPLGSDANCAGT